MLPECRAALQAARDVFYRGPIAHTLAHFAAELEVLDHSGTAHCRLIAYEDLAGYATRIEEPVTVGYRSYQVYKCGPWCQGPVFLQQLRLLEGFDLAALGYNTVPYIHTVLEVAKMAFADRERCYGDPLFAHVPLDRLLTRAHAPAPTRPLDAIVDKSYHPCYSMFATHTIVGPFVRFLEKNLYKLSLGPYQ